MPSQYTRVFKKEFSLPSGENRRFDGITAGFTKDIDTYFMQVNIADGDRNDGNDFSSVGAVERGAKEIMDEEIYNDYDFYVCDGAFEDIKGIIENDTAESSA